MKAPDLTLVHAAQRGDAASLEQLLRSVHDGVYRLALRMTACPADAEDSTQEVLVRVITQLSTFRGDAAFTTWVHRVAVNHLLDRSRSRVEQMQLTFVDFADDLRDGLAAGPSSAPDAALLEREVQLACTHALLCCLDREHRVAYVLGEIFEVDSDEGGYICDVPAATYRKRLSRARTRVRAFLEQHCGLVSDHAACRCERRVDTAVALGRVNRDHLMFADRTAQATNEIVELYDASELLRRLPQPIVPAERRDQLLTLLRDTIVGR
jgi:RNA polymerase sigma factor (sigma-70 family)